MKSDINSVIPDLKRNKCVKEEIIIISRSLGRWEKGLYIKIKLQTIFFS